MNTAEKMNRYIQLTKVPGNARYSMLFSEAQALCDMAFDRKVFNAISLAFQYGQAKGYRMARRAKHD